MSLRPPLELRELTTSFRTEAGRLTAVDRVSLTLRQGRTLALVGESGCGKSVTALSVMRLLLDTGGSIDGGQILLEGEDLLGYTPAQMRDVRGRRISIIFQDPMTALNPVFTVGQQIMEIFRIHRRLDRRQAREAAIAMLAEVQIPDPERNIDAYPFQLSGGMLQRVMIAIALACDPKVLIADEPTTALDVTIQAQILALLRELQETHDTAILLITHDLGVVAEIAHDVAIMYAGRIVEQGPFEAVFAAPAHPYTRGLIASIPGPNDTKDRPLPSIPGTVPSLGRMPEGCRFHPRCGHAGGLCRQEVPLLEPQGEAHDVACHWAAGRL